MKKFRHPDNIQGVTRKRVEALLWLLRTEGPFEHDLGRARHALLERLADLGYEMSVHSLNRLLTEFGPPPKGDGQYPYYYIETIMNKPGRAANSTSKRTYKIGLCVDPERVPFPPNPFETTPAFIGAKKTATAPKPPPVIRNEPVEAEQETFARQAQFDGVIVELPEPTPPEDPPDDTVPDPVDLEPVDLEPPVVEFDDIEEPAGVLTPYLPPPVTSTNGGGRPSEADLLDELAGDLLAPAITFDGPKDSTDLIAKAISLLSDALAARAQEGGNSAVDVDRQINQRLAEFRVLQAELEHTKSQLRHVLGKYEKLIQVARQQRREIERLTKPSTTRTAV